MSIRTLDRTGLWLTTHRWNVAYWTPFASWVPLSVRSRRRWWGAIRVDHLA